MDKKKPKTATIPVKINFLLDDDKTILPLPTFITRPREKPRTTPPTKVKKTNDS